MMGPQSCTRDGKQRILAADLEVSSYSSGIHTSTSRKVTRCFTTQQEIHASQLCGKTRAHCHASLSKQRGGTTESGGLPLSAHAFTAWLQSTTPQEKRSVGSKALCNKKPFIHKCKPLHSIDCTLPPPTSPALTFMLCDVLRDRTSYAAAWQQLPKGINQETYLEAQ